MYLLVGADGCRQCEEMKIIFQMKHIPYHYVDAEKLDQQTLLYLKAYFPTYPMILKAEWQFINFKDMKEHYSFL